MNRAGGEERLAAQYGIDTEWRMVDGEAMTVLPQHARYADLCIFGAQTPAVSTSAGYRFSEEMLFTAGRPVLLVPEAGNFTALGAHVAVAWNSSRAAARALNDALPLLEHLQRHGISAQAVELSDVPAAMIADALQDRALAAGADTIVAGAHGHTWLREVLLGSVTRDLLWRPRLPVMMSH